MSLCGRLVFVKELLPIKVYCAFINRIQSFDFIDIQDLLDTRLGCRPYLY